MEANSNFKIVEELISSFLIILAEIKRSYEGKLSTKISKVIFNVKIINIMVSKLPSMNEACSISCFEVWHNFISCLFFLFFLKDMVSSNLELFQLYNQFLIIWRVKLCKLAHASIN